MRLSTDKSDWLGYPAHLLFKRHGITPRIYLDGDYVKFATMADTETGEVERLKTNAYGRIVVGPHGVVEREILRGCVTIDLVGPTLQEMRADG